MEPAVPKFGQRGCEAKEDGTAAAFGGECLYAPEGVGEGRDDGVTPNDGDGVETGLLEPEHAARADRVPAAAVAVRKVRRRMGLLETGWG